MYLIFFNPQTASQNNNGSTNDQNRNGSTFTTADAIKQFEAQQLPQSNQPSTQNYRNSERDNYANRGLGMNGSQPTTTDQYVSNYMANMERNQNRNNNYPSGNGNNDNNRQRSGPSDAEQEAYFASFMANMGRR